jgi:hypothetical protein
MDGKGRSSVESEGLTGARMLTCTCGPAPSPSDQVPVPLQGPGAGHSALRGIVSDPIPTGAPPPSVGKWEGRGLISRACARVVPFSSMRGGPKPTS